MPAGDRQVEGDRQGAGECQNLGVPPGPVRCNVHTTAVHFSVVRRQEGKYAGRTCLRCQSCLDH